ncbi:MAG: replication initiation protein [Thermoproteus sp. AZ2]|uniref:Replication initiation protein n=1 Tax=Thermoproteus sp. AZ2 TaxID=1609232 RepID=A0ACC6V1X5_9CREN|nr:MAG: replication initiation protein [Thermoproteus sp. AZ2]
MSAPSVISDNAPIRSSLKKDVPQILGVGPFKSGSSAFIPLFLALKLSEIGAAEIDEASLLTPQEVSQKKFAEEKEQRLVELPADFYARARATIWRLKKEGDSKEMARLISELRDLVIRRVEKMARLLAASPDLAENEEFLSRLTPEERALALSLYIELSSFIQSVLA